MKGVATTAVGAMSMGMLDSPAIASSDEGMISLVHPDLRPLMPDMLRIGRSMPALSAQTLATQRAAMKRFQAPYRQDVPYERKMVPGKAGRPDVVIWIVNAKPGSSLPGIVYMHGGGMVSGGPEIDLKQSQDLAADLGCVLISVAYRLAPETLCTESVEDNYAALKWFYDNAKELGVDRARIAVAGGSAGGGHAALLAVVARDRAEVPIAFQCLIYPMLDDRTGSTISVPPTMGQLAWTAEHNRYGWGAFLGQAPGLANVPAYSVPARIENLAGLPPAFIGVGTLDLFCLEDMDYARRLNAASVPTELVCVPGAFHGFDMIGAQTHVGKWFRATMLNAFSRAFGMPPRQCRCASE